MLETCQKHNNLSETFLSFPINVEIALQEPKALEHIWCFNEWKEISTCPVALSMILQHISKTLAYSDCVHL